MNLKNNNMKIEMLDAFFKQFYDLYDDLKKESITLETFNFEIRRLIRSYGYCRVDIKNHGIESNHVVLLQHSENDLITYPDWFKDKEGQGVKIESVNKKIKLKIKCVNDGKLGISLKGRDYRNHNGDRIPIHLFYNNLIVNNELILNENLLRWHNKPFIFEKEFKNNDKIDIYLDFSTIFDFFPELLELNYEFINETAVELEYENLKKYVENKKTILNSESENPNTNVIVYEKLNELSNDNYHLNKRFNDLETELNIYKRENEKILNSYNLLFNSIFKYYDLKPKKLYAQYKELTKQLLDFINNVCKKHELEWWLYGGTLLGAYRHSGFIPWDDDCDIGMLREDYDKFYEVFSNEIDNHNLKQLSISRKTITSNNTYLPFIKIDYRVENRLLSFVDVFPSDFISKIDEDVESIYEYEHKKLRRDLKTGIDREDALNEAFDALNISKEPTDKIISGIEDHMFTIDDYDTVFPLKLIKFEDRLYPCPNNPKKYMETEYGTSFMSIPPVTENHGFLQHIERWDDVYELLDENINLLKEINAKFK